MKHPMNTVTIIFSKPEKHLQGVAFHQTMIWSAVQYYFEQLQLQKICCWRHNVIKITLEQVCLC